MPGERDGSPGPSRLKNFKNVGKDMDEMRRRRQETSVELRKQKKDEQLNKRRNVQLEDISSPTSPEAPLYSVAQMSFEEILNGIASKDQSQILKATQACRKMLSKERNPPIDTIINAGAIDPLVRFLSQDDNPALQFEAAWALTNIASGTSVQTQAVASAGAVSALIKLLGSPHLNVAEQAVWALGNISGDGPHLRDFVINAGIIKPLLSLIRPDLTDNFLGNVTWTVSNLCRNKNPPPPFDKIKECLPSLAVLIRHPCKEVIADACWALSYFTDGSNEKIQSVVDTGVIPHLVSLLQSNVLAVVTPSLRTIGNIVTGSDSQTDEVIKAGALPIFVSLLMHQKHNIVKEAAWTISNIAAGNSHQIQSIIEAKLLEPLLQVLEHGDFRAKKEAAWAVTNYTNGGTNSQIIYMLQLGYLGPFCRLLECDDAKTIVVVLDGLTHILEAAMKINELDRVCEWIEECKGLDILEELQAHENEEVYKKTANIIEKYFGAEQPEDEDVVSSSTYEFSANVVPDGGFSF